ncbi:hypothetical protein MKW98_013507 [Papaver atlanticum]|uniref:Peptidase A1 domain-containing protein n=1 Tax=Papaver atlanticum TaxID=357466 RepID=A0AAD4XIX3_9MAGN|nr:hypothetical protein MKW98_013507 [Papaver atlanticum]
MDTLFSSSIIHFLLLHLLLVFLSLSNAQTPQRAGIIFDLERDPSTLQYMIKMNQGTPLADVKLVLDLGGILPWFRCRKGYYNSSSIRPVSCYSHICPILARTCFNTRVCSTSTSNPVSGFVARGDVISDLVTLISNPDSYGTVPVPSPSRLAFGCANSINSLSGFAEGAKGVAGLGRSSVLSLVSQFTLRFRLPRIFAIELYGGSSTRIYFGGHPYVHYDISDEVMAYRFLTYTPLLINPKSREEYFVDLKSIVVHGTTVPINAKLLSINKETGSGGTKIDIQTPYTTLETSIYNAVVEVYNEWAKSWNATTVAAVAPFTACYKSSTLPSWINWKNPISPPSLSFVFPESRWDIAWWDLFKVNDVAHCVQFLDGGSNPKTSIVIGARQIEFVEFDLVRSRFGFVQPNFWDPES